MLERLKHWFGKGLRLTLPVWTIAVLGATNTVVLVQGEGRTNVAPDVLLITLLPNHEVNAAPPGTFTKEQIDAIPTGAAIGKTMVRLLAANGVAATQRDDDAVIITDFQLKFAGIHRSLDELSAIFHGPDATIAAVSIARLTAADRKVLFSAAERNAGQRAAELGTSLGLGSLQLAPLYRRYAGEVSSPFSTTMYLNRIVDDDNPWFPVTRAGAIVPSPTPTVQYHGPGGLPLELQYSWQYADPAQRSALKGRRTVAFLTASAAATPLLSRASVAATAWGDLFADVAPFLTKVSLPKTGAVLYAVGRAYDDVANASESAPVSSAVAAAHRSLRALNAALRGGAALGGDILFALYPKAYVQVTPRSGALSPDRDRLVTSVGVGASLTGEATSTDWITNASPSPPELPPTVPFAIPSPLRVVSATISVAQTIQPDRYAAKLSILRGDGGSIDFARELADLRANPHLASVTGTITSSGYDGKFSFIVNGGDPSAVLELYAQYAARYRYFYIEALPVIDDCARLEDKAITAAIVAARERVQEQAVAEKVQLGSLALAAVTPISIENATCAHDPFDQWNIRREQRPDWQKGKLLPPTGRLEATLVYRVTAPH